ncbi:amino acid permease [Myxococcus qinghaiensis]|uniref:amino acid permease n=1 Tax=Myxococcus qinghaiensis TaxID=2906758 RepID=UPI0020A7D40E|nr:amino acid permease [Myxococcus qinghaiensis]MCP3167047.1 APC family permease [Myxococcus qinghaiensis]
MNWPAMGLLSASAVINLTNVAAMAEYGLGSVVLYLIPALVFLLPAAFIAAELGSTWPGGVFTWVHEALGEKWAFCAAWQQWVQNVIFYPLLLSFAAGNLAYVVSPELARSGPFNGVFVLAGFGLCAAVAIRGVGHASRFSVWGVVLGLVFPTVLLTVLAALYLLGGHASATPLEASHFLPPWSGIGGLVLVVGNFLAYGGVEVSAVHVREMKDARHGYPKAMVLMALLATLIFVFSTLGVAVAVQSKDLDLSAGLIQAFETYLSVYGLKRVASVFALLFLLATLGTVLTWILGPNHSLLLVGRKGLLPPFFQRTNVHGTPTALLATQTVLVALLALAFFVAKDVNQVYWALAAMTTQLYIPMYGLLFVSALKLRRTRPDVPRGYRAPALPLLAWVGIVSCTLAFIVGFVPPKQLQVKQPIAYVARLGGLVFTLAAVPFVIYARRRPEWRQPHP